MTSDFENDEVKDSAFPVEFNDDTGSLDMYGVWVKDGPRDAPVASKQSEIPPVTASEHDAFPEIDLEPLSDTLPDLSDFDALPDFDNPHEDLASDADQEIIQFEEITLTAETSPVSDSKTNAIAETDSDTSQSVTSIESVDLDFNIVDANEFLDIPEETSETNLPEDSEFDIESVDSEIVFDEIRTDELLNGSEIDSNENNETVQDISDVSPQSEIDLAEIVSNPSFEQVDENQFDLASGQPDDFSALSPPVAAEAESFPEVETDTNVSSKDEEVDLSDFVVQDDLPTDDDFSSFLDDLNSAPVSASPASQSRPTVASGSDSLDLDSFIDSFNETGGESHEEAQKKLYDDTEPVDLVLEFDESFIEDSEKIRATGSAVSESEFFNSEFGVEMIDETSAPVQESFDTMFDSIPDLESGSQNSIARELDSRRELEITDEFDDLLQKLDLAPAPAQGVADNSVREAKKKGYALTVTEEDGFESLQSAIVETASSDDIEVTLFGSTAETPNPHPAQSNLSLSDEKIDRTLSPTFTDEIPITEEILDIPDIRDYNETDFGLVAKETETPVMEETVSIDFDDISAVEHELNDITPDTGDEAVVTNDKSTELLMLIANELSSIKNEITTLKSELSAFKNAGLTVEPAVSPVIESKTENSGFFSDDDTDETIALTGDELNNILITADFTEEKNEGVPEDAPFDEEDFGLSDVKSEEIIPAVSDTIDASPSVSEQIAPETIPSDILAEEHGIPETLPDSIFDGPLTDDQAIDVSHITTIEDDTSYLDGSEVNEPVLDDVVIEEPELETIDFEGEKLEEPELAEFNIDLTEIEAGFPATQDVPVPEAKADGDEGSIAVESMDFTELPADSALDIPDLSESIESTSEFEPSVIDDLGASEAIPEEPQASEPLVETSFGEPFPEVSATETQVLEDVPQESALAESEPESVPESSPGLSSLPLELKNEIKSVLSYMDQLLESLPEDKIEEFAHSEHFEVYKKLFEDLGIS